MTDSKFDTSAMLYAVVMGLGDLDCERFYCEEFLELGVNWKDFDVSYSDFQEWRSRYQAMRAKRIEEIRQAALSKLTPEERKALGFS